MVDLPNWPAPPSILRTKVDPSKLRTDADFCGVTADLAQEISQWLVDSTLIMPFPAEAWEAEREAILCAQVVRLAKMLDRMAKALQATDEEAALIFGRCAFETIVNFHYLRAPSGDEAEAVAHLRLYKSAGFRPELKIRRDLRNRSIQEGTALDGLEQKVLEGLDAFWESEEIPEKVVELPDMTSRLRMADMDPKTEIVYFSIPSQAIHGTYQNLTRFHLKPGEVEGTMVPLYQTDEINATVFQAIVEQSLSILDHWLLCIHPSLNQRWSDDLLEFHGRMVSMHLTLAAFIQEGFDKLAE